MKTISLIINGISNAFISELGCKCEQCTLAGTKAHTSASIVIKDGKKIDKHLLFDFGSGVVDSLIQNKIDKVDYIFNTHNHLDHIADFDRLINSISRRFTKEEKKLPGNKPVIYSTNGTYLSGIKKMFYWVSYYNWVSINRYIENKTSIEDESIINGLGVNLKVTPIPVYHGGFAFEPVIYVIEFGDIESNTYKKIIFAWDLLHLVTKFPNLPELTLKEEDINKEEDMNSISYKAYSFEPTKAVSKGYSNDDYDKKNNYEDDIHNNVKEDKLLPEHEILKNADILFLAGNTINTHPETGHMSIKAGINLLKRITPKKTFITHYSGHEDKKNNSGAKTYGALRKKVNELLVKKHLQLDVEIAIKGYEIDFTV